ncbi:hypothetical protein P154DRAFT_530340 [Amniculicola lignicola CBS 123094]|uniref:DUF6594 domain-containing protein n=1 Tax=Amniculicola lignicola CBS 123094 TaxID=1392246 RepID=A0A6A5WW77_9PLEO|nr:hypothetical protein P154DRAFT_530340 [Amniculicola lignicola CBS 123094]
MLSREKEGEVPEQITLILNTGLSNLYKALLQQQEILKMEPLECYDLRDLQAFFSLERALKLLPWFSPFLNPDPSTGRVMIWDDHIHQITFWIMSAIAPFLAVASVVVHIYGAPHSTLVNLGLMMAFQSLAGICLNILTHASRVEVFAANDYKFSIHVRTPSG